MLTAFSLLLAPQSACACSCALSSEPEFTNNADLIFVGVVTAIDKPFGIGGGGELKVDFVVEDVSKGDSAGHLTLLTASDGAACGYDFKVGHRFKVYANDGHTGLCSGNQLLGSAPEVPVDKPFPVGLVAVGGGVLVAGLIAFALHRRRAL
ncbi:hypothetical protein [Rhizocola hellebori]|nr:hypothetical protein [Rhizocola hellebori]